MTAEVLLCGAIDEIFTRAGNGPPFNSQRGGPELVC